MTLRILYPFAGDTVGGSHRSTIEIIRSLDRTRFEPVIVLHRKDGPLRDILRQENIPFEFIDIPYPPKMLNVFKGIVTAKKFLKARMIDVVHCDDGPLRYIWLYAAKASGVKYIHVQRTLPRLHPEKFLSYYLADGVAANSQATKSRLPVKAPVIYPSVHFKYGPQDRARNRQEIFKKYGFAEYTKLIVFVANLHDRKRPEVFIQMAAQLRGKKFIMAGGFHAGMEQKLTALIRENNLENDLIFAGFQEDPQSIISAADVLVAPAKDEAFGRTLIEAMGLGTPVVASDEGGHREIIEDGVNGYLVLGGAAEFAVKVAEALQAPESLVHQGLETAAKFSKTNAAGAFAALYSGKN